MQILSTLLTVEKSIDLPASNPVSALPCLGCSLSWEESLLIAVIKHQLYWGAISFFLPFLQQGEQLMWNIIPLNLHRHIWTAKCCKNYKYSLKINVMSRAAPLKLNKPNVFSKVNPLRTMNSPCTKCFCKKPKARCVYVRIREVPAMLYDRFCYHCLKNSARVVKKNKTCSRSCHIPQADFVCPFWSCCTGQVLLSAAQVTIMSFLLPVSSRTLQWDTGPPKHALKN